MTLDDHRAIAAASVGFAPTPDDDDDDEGGWARARLVTRILGAILEDPQAMARLHEVERMMVSDLHQEPRRQRCPGCLRLARAFHQKAMGVDYEGV